MDVTVTDQGSDEREERMRMVAESAKGVLKSDRNRARALRFTHPGFDLVKWAALAEQGWLMLRVPESWDGLGMGLSELSTIARAMGGELTPEPIAMAALIAPDLPDDDLAAVLACEAVVLPAFAPYRAEPPHLRDGRLTGSVEPVPYAAGASHFLVQTSDGAALVEASADGFRISIRESHDGGHLGTLILDSVPAKHVQSDMVRLREEAALVLSAQLLGIAESAFDITLTYLRDRKQFGHAIGTFQALQHRAVDLFLELNLMRASMEAAAAALDSGAVDDDAERAVSLAKARATRGVHLITQAAIQLHGGIGYTDEADIGLYLRRAMTVGGLLGSEAFHRNRALRLSEELAV